MTENARGEAGSLSFPVLNSLWSTGLSVAAVGNGRDEGRVPQRPDKQKSSFSRRSRDEKRKNATVML